MGTVLSNMSQTTDNLMSVLFPLLLLWKPGILDRNKTEMHLGNLNHGTNSSNDLKHSYVENRRSLPVFDFSCTMKTSAPAQRSENEFEKKNPLITLFSLFILYCLNRNKKYEGVDYHESCHLQASSMSKHFLRPCRELRFESQNERK